VAKIRHHAEEAAKKLKPFTELKKRLKKKAEKKDMVFVY
jgi:hypothetical protein